jgi:hypothetical protein
MQAMQLQTKLDGSVGELNVQKEFQKRFSEPRKALRDVHLPLTY